jgi:hypothetical protein
MASREENTRGAMGTRRRVRKPSAASIEIMAQADFDAVPSLAEAMGFPPLTDAEKAVLEAEWWAGR